MPILPLVALVAATLPAGSPADTARYLLTATLSSAITPEGEAQPQEQVIEARGWLQLSVPTAGGTLRAVIDSGSWTTQGFAMVHEVSTAALRGMELRATLGADGAPTTAVTGAGEHPIAAVFQDVLGYVRGLPTAGRTDSLNTSTDGDHWRLRRTVTWERRDAEWRGAIASVITAREPDTSAGTEEGSVVLRAASGGSLDGATVQLTRTLTISSEHGTVLVRQVINGTVSRLR
jgi:hypothetical protein